MADNIKVHPLDVRGTQIDVYITPSGGWTASIGETSYSGQSREELYQRLMSASRKKAVKVEVPFSKLENKGHRQEPVYEIIHGVATGIHQGTGNVLVKISKYGRMVSEQWENPFFGGDLPIMRPVTTEEGERLIELAKAHHEAYEAFRLYKSSLEVRLKDEVNQAIETASKALAEEESKKANQAAPIQSPYMEDAT